MGLFQWFAARHDWAVEFLRMVLGVLLMAKGIEFMSEHMAALEALIGLKESPWITSIFAHYIIFAHLLGGVFITIGLVTRVAALAQLPVLLGGLCIVFIREGLSGKSSNLEYTALILMLLVMYLFYGGGRLSVDHLLETRRGT
ncbi:MAG: DoxX family protein [Spirochaetia bacterium]|nr:DoxX family protein [Spirochaetia bacterium]